MINPQQMFQGIQGARAKTQANYERPGRYFERIDRCKCDQNRKGEAFVAVEKTVIYVISDDQGRGHKEGECVTHMMMQKHDSFLSNVKTFIANTLGMKPEDITEQEAMQVFGDDQPLAGTVVEVNNVEITTQRGTPFTAINYKREVPASELLQVLPQHAQDAYFPGGVLQRLAQMEGQEPQGNPAPGADQQPAAAAPAAAPPAPSTPASQPQPQPHQGYPQQPPMQQPAPQPQQPPAGQYPPPQQPVQPAAQQYPPQPQQPMQPQFQAQG